MKKFIISFLFVIIGLFIVDRIGGMVMWWVNQNTQDMTAPKLRYLIENVNEDVILMGTSRCNCHYVPSIISDTIGMSVYNGGIDASDNIYSHYIMLCHILDKHIPKIICLELMATDFKVQVNPFNSTSFFAPYFGSDERADSVFRLSGQYWKYKLSHLYRYNAKAISNITGLFISRQEGEDNGYIPSPQPEHYPDSLKPGKKPIKTDSLKLKYLDNFINLCRQNNIKLVFTISPKYSQVSSSQYDVLKSVAQKKGIPILDYHTTGLFHDHPDYFRDPNHLWHKGATLYSSIFASDLKRALGI